MTTSLYDTDLEVWINQQIAYLKSGEYNKLDLDNLIEEIESVGKTERRSMESYFVILIAHLLKWQYQPSHRSKSWLGSIDNSRHEILRILKDSPSLKNYMPTAFKDAYGAAKRLAIRETGLPKNTISEFCPFSMSYAMDEVLTEIS